MSLAVPPKRAKVAGQAKKSFFATEYPKIRAALNAKLGINTSISIAKFDTKDLNVRELCVACVYLAHNVTADPDNVLPNIDNLDRYDMMQFTYSETLVPYASYLMGKDEPETKRGRKKTIITIGVQPSAIEVEKQRRKTAAEEAEMFDYITSLIRYLFILQAKGVHRDVSVGQGA